MSIKLSLPTNRLFAVPAVRLAGSALNTCLCSSALLDRSAISVRYF